MGDSTEMVCVAMTPEECAAERLSVGEYTVSPYRGVDGGFWIRHHTGEGMQVSEKVLAEWLHKFYQEHF